MVTFIIILVQHTRFFFVFFFAAVFFFCVVCLSLGTASKIQRIASLVNTNNKFIFICLFLPCKIGTYKDLISIKKKIGEKNKQIIIVIDIKFE